MKRYVDLSKCQIPKPLKSNWPDLGVPKPDCTKVWRYYVHRIDGSLVYESKDYYKARDYWESARRQSSVRLIFSKYTPSEEQLHENRLTEKATWRWNAGFGA